MNDVTCSHNKKRWRTVEASITVKCLDCGLTKIHKTKYELDSEHEYHPI